MTTTHDPDWSVMITEDEAVNLIRYPRSSMTVEQCLQVIDFIRSQGRKLAEYQQWWEKLEHRGDPV